MSIKLVNLVVLLSTALVMLSITLAEKCRFIEDSKTINFTDLAKLDKWTLQLSNYVSENCSVWNFTINPKNSWFTGFLTFAALEPDDLTEYGSFYLEESPSTPNKYNVYSVNSTKTAPFLPLLFDKPVGTSGSFVDYKKEQGFIFFLCIDNTQYYWVLTASQNAQNVTSKYAAVIDKINRSNLEKEGKAVTQSCAST